MRYYPYNGMFVLKKKLNSDTYYNTDELWKHAKWNKPDTNGQLLHDSLTWNAKFIKTESRTVFTGERV